MIVRCPQCAARYRVREEKLPQGGGNIQCPSCGHIFLVNPRDAELAPPPPTAKSAVGGFLRGGTQQSIPLPARDVGPAPPVVAKQWKLRSPVGLVYDFPDVDALRSWISSRDSISGMSASHDGGVSWAPVEEVEELHTAIPLAVRRRSEQGLPRANSGPHPTTLLTPPTAVAPAAYAEPKTRQMVAQSAGPAVPSASPPISAQGKPMVVGRTTGSFAAALMEHATRRGQEPPPGPLPTFAETVDEHADTRRLPSSAYQTVGSKPIAAPAPVGPSPSAMGAAAMPPPQPVSGSYASVGAASSTLSRPQPSLPSAARLDRSGARPRVPTGEPQRVGRARRPYSGIRQTVPPKREAGLGTWIAVVVLLLLMGAGGVHVAGVVDVLDLLGLRGGPSAVDPSGGQTNQPSPQRPQLAIPGPNDFQQSEADSQLTDEPQTGRQNSLDLLSERREGRANPHASRVASLREEAFRANYDGELGRAISLLSTALQLDRRNVDIVCELAVYHRQDGAFDDADRFDQQCDMMRAAQSPAPDENLPMEP